MSYRANAWARDFVQKNSVSSTILCWSTHLLATGCKSAMANLCVVVWIRLISSYWYQHTPIRVQLQLLCTTQCYNTYIPAATFLPTATEFCISVCKKTPNTCSKEVILGVNKVTPSISLWRWRHGPYRKRLRRVLFHQRSETHVWLSGLNASPSTM